MSNEKKIKLNSDIILKFFLRDKSTWHELGFISEDEEPYSCCMWHALGELYGSYGPEEKDYSNQSYVKFIKPFLISSLSSSSSHSQILIVEIILLSRKGFIKFT